MKKVNFKRYRDKFREMKAERQKERSRATRQRETEKRERKTGRKHEEKQNEKEKRTHTIDLFPSTKNQRVPKMKTGTPSQLPD